MNRTLIITGFLFAFALVSQTFTPLTAQSPRDRSQAVEARRALAIARTQ